jgi:hypothetical protein
MAVRRCAALVSPGAGVRIRSRIGARIRGLRAADRGQDGSVVDARLHTDQLVTINLPEMRSRVRDFDATVIATVPSAVILEPVGIDPEVLAGHTDDVFLSFAAGSGLVALKGALTHERGQLRFQVQDNVRVRARRATRVDAELPVTVAGAEGMTVNVSAEGLLARVEAAVALDDVVEVTVTLAPRPVSLQARVVRLATGMVALQFAEPNPMLEAFVVERRTVEVRGA